MCAYYNMLTPVALLSLSSLGYVAQSLFYEPALLYRDEYTYYLTPENATQSVTCSRLSVDPC